MKKTFFSLMMLLAMSLSTFASNQPNPVNEGLKVGDKAPDFSLMSTEDRKVSLANFENAKGYIVIFSCNHCPWVVKYEDRMIDLHNKYAAMGYPVIAINPNDPEVQPEDSFANMKKRVQEKNFPFTYLIDEGQKIFPLYGATRTPQVYLLDVDRTVKYIGAIDDNAEDSSKVETKYLENAIAALQKGQDPDPSMTKAVGCSIKVKK